MKDYIGELDTSLMNDSTLNPAWPEQSRDVGQINKIVVHHEAQDESYAYDDQPRYDAEATYQNNSSIPGSRGLQYHFKIDNVGQISQIRPLGMILWHAGNLDVNNHSIGICVDGNFEDQTPTREQFEALKALLDWLSTQHPEFPAVQADVYAHSEVIDTRYFPGGTACCGANLRPFVVDYRNGNGNVPIPDVSYQHPELQPAVLSEPVVASPASEPTQTPQSPTESQPAPSVVDPAPESPSVTSDTPQTGDQPVATLPSDPQGAVVPETPSTPPIVTGNTTAPSSTTTPSNVSNQTANTKGISVMLNKLNLHVVVIVLSYIVVIAGALVNYFSATDTATLVGLLSVVVGAIEHAKITSK